MASLLRCHDEREGFVLFGVPSFSLVASQVTVLLALLVFYLLVFALLLALLLLLLLLRLHRGHAVHRRFWGLESPATGPHVRRHLVHLIKVVFRGASMWTMGPTTHGTDLWETRRLWRRGPAVVGPPWPVWATGWLWCSSIYYFRPRRFSFDYLARQQEILV